MLTKLSHHWWWLALQGLAIILFGFIALAWRGDTLGSFILLFGGCALGYGLLTSFAALTHATGYQRWWILLQGWVSVALAVISLIRTETAAIILLYMVTGWSLITGILELIGAWELRRNVSNERLLSLSGMASIIFAVLVIDFPKTAVFNLAGMVAAFAIICGLLTLAFSLNIRSMAKVYSLRESRTNKPSIK